MYLYKTQSSKNYYAWTTSLKEAREQFNMEVEYMGDDSLIYDDDIVELFRVDLYDVCEEYEKDVEIEDIMDDIATPIKGVRWDWDEDRGDPKEKGYDFDYFVHPIEIDYEGEE